MSRSVEPGDADSLAAKIVDRFDLRPRPGIDSEYRQRAGDGDQVAAGEAARDNRAAARIADRKLAELISGEPPMKTGETSKLCF